MTNRINHRFALAMTKLQYTDPASHGAVKEKLEDFRAFTRSWQRRALAAESSLTALKEEQCR